MAASGVDAGGGEEAMILERRGTCHEKEIRDVLGGGKEFGVGKARVALVSTSPLNCTTHVYNHRTR